MKVKGILIVALLVAGLLAFASMYTVDETEQVVVTQFGKVVGQPKTSPGLYFKVPFIQLATYFPKNLLEWDGEPGQIPTLDKTYIWVDTFARWRIVDPIKFFQTVNNTVRAMARLDDIIGPSVRNFITSYPLIEVVRNTNRVLDTYKIGLGQGSEKDLIDMRSKFRISTGRAKITEGIRKQAQRKLTAFGIQIVDIKIKRINYVESVRKAVYNRMIAERKQIAAKFRSEGRGKAQKILGDKERDLKQIESQAYRSAQEIKGKADARTTKLYAQAYNVDPEFYSFIKSLDVYKSALGNKTSLIMSTQSDFLKYLQNYTK